MTLGKALSLGLALVVASGLAIVLMLMATMQIDAVEDHLNEKREKRIGQILAPDDIEVSIEGEPTGKFRTYWLCEPDVVCWYYK